MYNNEILIDTHYETKVSMKMEELKELLIYVKHFEEP